MDQADLDKFIEGVRASLKSFIPHMPWATEQEKLKRAEDLVILGVKLGDVKMVKENIGLASRSLDPKKLIKLNLENETREDKQARLDILDIILEENSRRREPSQINELESALKTGCTQQFHRLVFEMKKLKHPIPPLTDVCLYLPGDNCFEAIGAVIDVGLASKDFAETLFPVAVFGKKPALAKKLVSLGADPTKGGSHDFLISLDQRPKAEVWGSPPYFAIKLLLETYSLKALRSLGAPLKGGVGLRQSTRELVELETQQKSKKLVAKVVEDLSDEVLTL